MQQIALDVTLHGSFWVLTRDGKRLHEFSHAERAVHEAVRLARELEESGQPARVRVETTRGKVIEVLPDPMRTPPQEH
ncbi:hypothetical protein [Caulobacter sp. 17J80-11]|uniref:hypothetical protein n=1 Tax=Caulobacter sp. 17J80-11 TaxID=2763502 RepID=UPI001653E7E6|nr:hypothetical protein [Caulobacter sp. 17J80-11]MBC6982944.1 hypothetical protein [Caulobacter sp. 17J80-11]